MSLGGSVERKAGATVFLTSEDEWYKAAYDKGGGTSAGYWDYAAGADANACTVPGATAHTANCDYVIGDLTERGSYTGSASPSGTFDQGGNLLEWNEAHVGVSDRGLRGGYFVSFAGYLLSSLVDASKGTQWQATEEASP